MGLGECIAAGGLDEAAGQRLARGEGDRMDQDVEPVPGLAQPREGGVDLGVDADVHRHDQRRAERGRELDYAILDAVVLVGEGELRALPLHGLRYAPGDRTIGGQAHHQGLSSRQKPHAFPSVRLSCRRPNFPRRGS